jgi:hypothetical protein
MMFTTTTRIVSGELVAGTTVELESTLTVTKTGKLHGVNTETATFLGDYQETKACGGQQHFMFRSDRGLFAKPVSFFDADTIAAYGEFKFDAQPIHENA